MQRFKHRYFLGGVLLVGALIGGAQAQTQPGDDIVFDTVSKVFVVDDATSPMPVRTTPAMPEAFHDAVRLLPTPNGTATWMFADDATRVVEQVSVEATVYVAPRYEPSVLVHLRINDPATGRAADHVIPLAPLTPTAWGVARLGATLPVHLVLGPGMGIQVRAAVEQVNDRAPALVNRATVDVSFSGTTLR